MTLLSLIRTNAMPPCFGPTRSRILSRLLKSYAAEIVGVGLVVGAGVSAICEELQAQRDAAKNISHRFTRMNTNQTRYCFTRFSQRPWDLRISSTTSRMAP